MQLTAIFTTLALLLLLTSCGLFQGDRTTPTCREIKKQMLFTGATSDRTSALQQQAQSGNLARAYRNEGC